MRTEINQINTSSLHITGEYDGHGVHSNEIQIYLSKDLIDIAASFQEFANGGMQVSAKTKDGKIYHQILLSNCKHIVAMRGQTDLPFSVNDIVKLFQTEEDKNPKQKGNWNYWDDWEDTA